MRYLTEEEKEQVTGGEVMALTAVMTVLVTAIIAVICYKLFMSSKGSSTIPGGWKFSWAL